MSTTEAAASNHPGIVKHIVKMDELGKLPPHDQLIDTLPRPVVHLIVAVPGTNEPKHYRLAIKVKIDPRLARSKRHWINEIPSGITVDTTLTPRAGEICCVEVQGLAEGHHFKLLFTEHLKITKRTVLIGVLDSVFWSASDIRERDQ